MITMGAYFLAKVYHDAYEQTELECGSPPIGSWDSLSKESKKLMAGGFQKMIDLGVIEPIPYSGLKNLRRAGWQSALTTDEKETLP